MHVINHTDILMFSNPKPIDCVINQLNKEMEI
jgi:hypothetical protein